MIVELVDENRRTANYPYLVRLPGWTWDRYLRDAPEMHFCEFEKGELVMHSPVEAEHQDVVAFLALLLRAFCEERGAGKVLTGPALIRVADDVGREPDIFVVPPEQAPRAKGMPLDIVPSLIVEVISPATRNLDLIQKAREYAALGVGEYWVVDQKEKSFYCHLLEGDSYTRREIGHGRHEAASLPGFWIDVGWLWQDPLPSAYRCVKGIL